MSGLSERLTRNRRQIDLDLGQSPRRQYVSATLLGQYRVTVPLAQRYVGGALIDLGCGVMPYRALIEPHTARYDSLDPRPQVEGITYQADLQDMAAVPAATYDSAICLEVLEHVPNPFKALADHELAGVTLSGDGLSIGALTTIRTLETSLPLSQKTPLLAQTASKLGSVQVRHRATIGGNLCNASPSADTAPALLALDAQVEIEGKTGTRGIELSRFFLGPGTTVLGDGEMLARLKIPLSSSRQGSVYYKLSTRKAMDLAFVGVAVLIELGRDDEITKTRIALGAVAPTPIRVPSAENLLKGTKLGLEAAREAAELAARSCEPISDHRASAAYRREMVRELCQQGLLVAYRQAKSKKEGKNKDE